MPAVPKVVQGRRKLLIEEACNWGRGTQEEPLKIFLPPCSDGSLVYFEKPGKEAAVRANGKVKNIHDMRPVVEVDNKKPKNASFTDVWSDLTEIAYEDDKAFIATLLLIYRSTFLIDHHYNKEGHLRYQPDPEISKCISSLEPFIGNVVSFGSIEKLLRFIDVLGWNEDVKYQASNKNGIERTGRINTLLTCIKIPYDTVQVLKIHDERMMKGIYQKTLKKGDMDKDSSYVPFYNIMQTLLRTRGICPASTKELETILSPYITMQSGICKSSGVEELPSIQRRLD